VLPGSNPDHSAPSVRQGDVALWSRPVSISAGNRGGHGDQPVHDVCARAPSQVNPDFVRGPTMTETYTDASDDFKAARSDPCSPHRPSSRAHQPCDDTYQALPRPSLLRPAAARLALVRPGQSTPPVRLNSACPYLAHLRPRASAVTPIPHSRPERSP
jgi:hypothetical protein